MNKAKRLIENMDTESASAICSEIGTIDENATPLKQARYINNILNTSDKKGICMTDTMRKCGGCCISANALKIAKKLYAKSNSIAEFLDLLNEADIGGRNLHISDNKIKITGMIYNYCECSAGWYKKLFSEVFEKNVSVKILNTIINGAEECTFEITDF